MLSCGLPAAAAQPVPAQLQLWTARTLTREWSGISLISQSQRGPCFCGHDRTLSSSAPSPPQQGSDWLLLLWSQFLTEPEAQRSLAGGLSTLPSFPLGKKNKKRVSVSCFLLLATAVTPPAQQGKAIITLHLRHETHIPPGKVIGSDRIWMGT